MSQRFFARVGIVLGGLLLLEHWLLTIGSLQQRRLFAWENYWHAPIGTITALIVLVFITPLWVWASFKFWNWRGDRPWQSGK
jgi:hypothetical protein